MEPDADSTLVSKLCAVVRFRPSTTGDSAQFRQCNAKPAGNGTFHAVAPNKMVVYRGLCFQPGLRYQKITIYEQWVCLPVSAAGTD
jgi:hypothetical protein